MKSSTQHLGFSQTIIALAVLAAFSPARAQEAADMTKQTSSISVGAGVVSGDEKDRARFGMFNGLRDHTGNLLLDFDYKNRDIGSGINMNIVGRNLGLDNRELGLLEQKPGDWKFTADYSELVRHDPRTINTGVTGIGTNNLGIARLAAPGAGSDVNLELKRTGAGLGMEKWFGSNLQFEANFKNEEKKGARFFGRGFACSATWQAAGNCTGTTQWALLMTPEPVNAVTKQFEAKLNWSGAKFLVSGGYYGSIYKNAFGAFGDSVPGVLNNPLGAATATDVGMRNTLQLPFALPPDNQSHQFYVDGNYRFTTATKATFKYAYTHATQSEDFSQFTGGAATGLASGRSNLGGELNTTVAQAGVTSRPWAKVNLLANVRYESKDNKTPIDLYNMEGANRFTNGNPSPKRLNGKLEGSYQLPANFRGTLGADYEGVDHGAFTSTDNVAGISGLKQKTKEWGYRGELRRMMSETLSGAVSYSSARRTGDSPWLKPASLPLTGVFEADPNCGSAGANACIYSRTGIFPFIFEDRKRDKWKFSADWAPTDRLSLQVFVEDGKDTFSGPSEKGLQDTGYSLFSLDAAYTLTDAWKMSAYLSQGVQTTNVAHSTGYDAGLKDTSSSFGVNVVGKPSSVFQVGGDLAYINDVLKYGQTTDSLATATSVLFLAQQGGLPDVTYRLLRLKLFSQYALDKHSSVRLDLVHQRSFFNEWTYTGANGVPFAYSDNTTLNANQNQNVTFVGARYIYSFQ